MPTAYGIGGTDATLSDMMLALAWGLVFGTLITLLIIPCFYLFEKDLSKLITKLSFPKKALPLLLISLFFTTPLNANTITLREFIKQASIQDTTFHQLITQNLALTYRKQRQSHTPNPHRLTRKQHHH